MANENTSLKELYAKYSKPNMTRAERQELMEKIARERYKIDKRKPITIKGQTVSNLICGIIIALEGIFCIIGVNGKKVFGDTSDIFFIAAIITCVVICIIMGQYKKELPDELSKELMTKATAYSAYVPMFIIVAIGVVMTLIGNKRDNEYFKVNSDQVMGLAFAMMGLLYIAKSIIYLWLDRTPNSDDEEE